jgi:DNA-binding CsgD family transcriptional regulator
MIKKAFDQMSATNSPFLTEAAPIYLKILHATNNVTEAKAIMKNENLIKSLESNFTEYALAYYNATLPFSTNPNELNNTLKRIILVSDSVHNQANRKDILEIEAKYQLTINEEKEALLKAENKILAQSINLKNFQLAIYLIAGILLLTFFFYSIKKYKQRITLHKQEINIKNVENEKLLLDADKYSQEMLKMQDIIETQKNNLLLHIEQMQSLENQIDLATEKNLYQEKNVLVKQLEKLKTGNKHIELFMAKFNTIFPKFSTRLLSKYPKLTNSDIMFCCLLRMNLTPKEIASILNIEQQSFYKRKYRLAEKIELADIEKFNEFIFSN